MQHDPLASLLDIKLAVTRALHPTEHLTFEHFIADEKTRWAVYSQFVIIGEAANRIPREWQLEHHEISWHRLTGMRNRMVHGYDNIRWDIVWNTLRADFSVLIEKVEQLLETMRPRDQE